MSDPATIVAYVSGHGYGHAARTGLVLRALQHQAPEVRIVVRTSTPAWMFPDQAVCVQTVVDVGIVQVDSLTPLIDETVSRAIAFERERPRLAATECAALTPLRPLLIVGDIPPLAFDVAAELGVPGVAIGNFSWSWIYRHIGSSRPEVEEIVEKTEASEARATRLLRLPLHDAMASFRTIEDAPLIAHVSHADRVAMRRRMLANAGRREEGGPLALLSFGGMGIHRLDLKLLANTPDVTFVLPARPPGELPPNLIVCPEELIPYHDLLASCDVVLMKPGYGTVADCLVNRVPMVYATRPGFAEEAILVEAMQDLGRAAFVAPEDLYQGRVGDAIAQALSMKRVWAIVPEDGAATIARRLIELGDQER
jgi:UDP:flavonoid glycosyltransferase YjiC (YdhE family)